MIGFPELPEATSWSAAREGFEWRLPAAYNIAWLISGRWAAADPERTALIALGPEGARRWSHREIWAASGRFANVLAAAGVGRGDRVAVLLPQSAETLICWLATIRLGAVIVPLFTLFGEDALAYRLADSGAKALLTDTANLPKVAAIRERAPDLVAVWQVEGPGAGAEGMPEAMARAREAAPVAETGPDDPALLSYTSGTTGPPKGALHGQRVLAAHVVGARMVYDFLPKPGDLMWTPADWAWMGGSMNAMAPALYHGVPLVAHRMTKFDPERAFALMAAEKVTVAFFPPTALKLMRRAPDPRRFGAALRTVGSAGEAMGAEVLAWGREAFGLSINEYYGQTECNMLIGNNARLMRPKPGWTGMVMPGHEAAILGPDLVERPWGKVGEIAIAAPDAGLFLGYWRNPEKTAEKLVTGPDGRRWLLTGDEGNRDAEGYFRFESRTDDVITSSGYRVGPTEIEDCLAAHPSVAVAAVVGAPDPIRTEAIRAFVKLAPGAEGGDRAAAALIAHVRLRLSPHLAPVSVDFLDEIPVTATGKIMRRELRARFTEG